MNYYHKLGKIYITEAELNYDALTENQIQFYLDNKVGYDNGTVSVSEILNCKFNEPVEVPLQQLVDMTTENYSKCEFNNIGASGAIKTNEYAKFGCQLAGCPIALACESTASCTISLTPKSLANINWVNTLYYEMFVKIAQIESGDRTVSLFPSENIKTKPYSYRECEEEFITVKREANK